MFKPPSLTARICKGCLSGSLFYAFLFIATLQGMCFNIRMNRLYILLALILFCATPSLAEVKITTNTQYYGVHGKTKNAINRSIRKNSPHEEGGRISAALTESQLRYDFSWRKEGNRCVMDKVTVHLHLTYTYPRLAPSPTGSLRSWWKQELNRFKEHEEIHGRISSKWASIIERELRNLKHANCNTVKNTVRSRIQYFTRKLEDEQRKFDRITNYGRNGKSYRVRD